MSLENILQGDFFSEYIKKGAILYYNVINHRSINIQLGDVLMVSEGQMTINNMFTLKEGINVFLY